MEVLQLPQNIGKLSSMPNSAEQCAKECATSVPNGARAVCQTVQSSVPNGARPVCHSDIPTIIYNNKRTTTITTIQPRVGDDVFVEMFDEFWNEYPDCERKTPLRGKRAPPLGGGSFAALQGFLWRFQPLNTPKRTHVRHGKG